MKHDIFISYKSESINTVMALAHALESAGIRCWYAPRNLDNSGAGKDYDDEIVDAIHNTRAVVVVLSEEALKSKWVKREVSQAEKYNKFVIPYVISELFTENGLRMRLEDKHWIDAYPNPEERFGLLIKNVKLLLDDGVIDELQDDNTEVIPSKPQPANSKTDFDYEEGMALYDTKSYLEAVTPLLRSAKNGNPKAKQQLCLLFYEFPIQLNKMDDDLWDEIEEQADNGQGYALFAMHCRYYKMGTQNDIAFKYIRRLLEIEEMPLGFLRAGICYNWGLGTKQNHAIGCRYYQRAIDGGCYQAYSYLGQEYDNGSDLIPADKEKAIEIYEKGLSLGDQRCGEMLCNMFLGSLDTIERAREYAQKMLDAGMERGYACMGNTYCMMVDEKGNPIGDYTMAEKWYTKALQHNEYSAYGSLAYLFGWVMNRRNDAYKMALQGVSVDDSYSYYLAGMLYEQDEDYSKAWKYFKMRSDRFGTGGVEMARQLFEHNYMPDDTTLGDLEQILAIEATNSIDDAAFYLLRLFVYEQNKEGYLDYSILSKHPQAPAIMRLGAEQGNSDIMYLYGRLLTEGEGKLYNPFEGRNWLRKAADKGDNDALDYLMWDESNIADYGEAYLKYYIEDKQEGSAPKMYKVLDHLLTLEKEEGKQLDAQILEYCFKIIRESAEFCGYLRLVKKHFKRIFPDYDPKRIEQGDLTDNDNFNLYYTEHTDFKDDIFLEGDPDIQRLYSLITNDVSTQTLVSRNKNCRWRHDQFGLQPDLETFLDTYRSLCSAKGKKPLEPPTYDNNDFIPFCFGTLAQQLAKFSMRCMLHLGFIPNAGSNSNAGKIGEQYDTLMKKAGNVLEYGNKIMFQIWDKEFDKLAAELNKYLFWLKQEGISSKQNNLTADD